ncbi:hypothetical protein SOVF_110040 [Spinacia oleracea]|nr:hypothetical protein SOVF_110040 [Spinacia oleracea]
MMHSASSLNAMLYIATLLIGLVSTKVEAQRAFFVFGDSLVDNGNNNFLATTARADRPPYGIDSSNGPTGRFSNGLNIVDLICEEIGTQPLLPYLDPRLTGDALLVGANFASAGVGVLDDTGIQFVNIIRIRHQLELFEQYQQRLAALIGEDEAQNRVEGALTLITLGGNDFINNYFVLPITARRIQFPNLQDYVNFVVSRYRIYLRSMYDLGLRRVLVTGTGPLGCVPGVLASQGSQNGECAALPNQADALFNPALTQMLQDLNSEIGEDVFVASNTGGMLENFLANPQAYGFETSKIACCGQGPYNGLGLCTTLSNICPDRNVYAFWDAYHPTERANRFIVQQMMIGSVDHMSPMNLSTILAKDSTRT